FAIYYNPLNLPTGITMNSGARFDYLYSAAGTKLAEIIYEPGESGTPAIRRDYAGIFEFENSSLARIALASGYITPLDLKQPFPGVLSDADETSSTMATLRPLKTNATYHLYAFDHQGNVIGVYNTKTATLEQTTDYYPYGLPHATPSLSTATNRRLYSAKELTTEAALNTYDFAARWQTPAFPRFTTPDPLAEQYTSIGPHVFCGGDPVNLVDPIGMDVYRLNIAGMLLSIEENSEYDEIIIVNNDGSDSDKTIRLNAGSINYSYPASTEVTDSYGNSAEIQYSFLVVNDSENTSSLFEFLASATKVEWSAASGINCENEPLNIITTSHSIDHEEGFSLYIKYTNMRNLSDIRFSRIDSHIHNHPSDIALPSLPDVVFANNLVISNHNIPIKFMVYSAKHHLYTEYDETTLPPSPLTIISFKVLCDILYAQ
ncbi:MAG: hypothetical protein HDS07_00225, partial [Bacteroides sp.]|nr:hypothetical protein [Bacteroides sp.]